ncbi:MAG TPA: hypothetical protein VN881_10875 [Candidatus Acidoferrales bacterium]|jgi:uncharacterized protein YycO|nr:hypothetical protein [Candidatus Acidoferrales bacterium]
MPIRLQLVTQPWDPVSAAIRFTTRSWSSHAEFVDVAAGTTLGSRSFGGVKVRPCANDHYSKVEQFTAAYIEQAYEWALTQVGKAYDYSAIAGIALDRNWRDGSRWFCSELVAMAFEQVGSPILSTRPSVSVWRITPRDLLLSRSLIYLIPQLEP